MSGAHFCRTAVLLDDIFSSIRRKSQCANQCALLLWLMEIQHVGIRGKCGIYLIVAVITGCVYYSFNHVYILSQKEPFDACAEG